MVVHKFLKLEIRPHCFRGLALGVSGHRSSMKIWTMSETIGKTRQSLFFFHQIAEIQKGWQHVQSKSNTSQDESWVTSHNCLKHDKWFIWRLWSQNLWTCWVLMDGFATSWNLKSSAEAVTSCLKDLLLSCKTYKYKHPDILFSYVQLYEIETIHIPYNGLTCSFFLIRGWCLTAFVFMCLKLHLLLLRQRHSLLPTFCDKPFVATLLLRNSQKALKGLLHAAGVRETQAKEECFTAVKLAGNRGFGGFFNRQTMNSSSKVIINGMDDLGSQTFLELNLTHESWVNYIDAMWHPAQKVG